MNFDQRIEMFQSKHNIIKTTLIIVILRVHIYIINILYTYNKYVMDSFLRIIHINITMNV